MNIFLRELKASRKSLIIWCIIVALFTLLGVIGHGAIRYFMHKRGK